MITFFTDPHLGLAARTNTSSKSSPALDFRLNHTASKLAEREGNKVMCGDLFHRSHNKENIIADGIKIASQCDVVVGGNHDFTNRTDDLSSMDIVAGACDSVLMSQTGKVTIYPSLNFDSGETLTVIPHHSSQDLFDKAVDEACKHTGDVVALHCNFNNPFVNDIDTALNLTPDQAAKLLKSYSYIVIGHEHIPRKEMDGRLIALGNTHPTGFSDISNKYVWTFDKESGFSRELIWSKETSYLALDAAEIWDLPETEFDVDEGAEPPQFVDISGELDAENMPELAHRISLIWDKWNPYMVRNQVNAVQAETESLMEEGYKIEDFSSKIREGLVESPELLALFEEKLEKVGE